MSSAVTANKSNESQLLATNIVTTTPRTLSIQSPVDTSKLPNDNALESMVSSVAGLATPSAKASTNEMDRKTATSTFSFPMPADEVIAKEHATLPVNILEMSYNPLDKAYGERSVGTVKELDEKYDKDTNYQFSLAIKNGNVDNNRYNNILPSNFNLYQIPGQLFYYNCSCVLGDPTLKGQEYYKSSRIIAAQAPKPNTIGAFWKMVISSDAVAIFQLVNSIEDPANCAPYYPDMQNKCLKCGEYAVELKAVKSIAVMDNIEEGGKFRIIQRELVISWMTNDGLKQKTLMQYHLLNWSDNGLVYKEILGELVKIGAIKIKEGRIVVHCSAGINRTGVFITTLVSHLTILNGKGSDKIIFETATALRQVNTGRVGSLDDPNQYRLCYETLRFLHR